MDAQETNKNTYMVSNANELKVIGDPLAINTKKIEIAALYAGINLTVEAFDPATASEKDFKEFLKKSPHGLIPVLETSEGCIYEANAILRYMGRYNDDCRLYGASVFEQALVDQFLDWSTLALEPVYAQYIMPYLGFGAYDKKVHDQALKNLRELLQVLEENLKKTKYLVGSNITLPDIQIVSLLSFNFRYNFDEKFRKGFPKLTEYYESVANEPNFKKLLGRPVLCKTPMEPFKVKK